MKEEPMSGMPLYGSQAPGPELPLCPFLIHPFPECYCHEATVPTVKLALTYCGRNYQRCRIYSRSAEGYGCCSSES